MKKKPFIFGSKWAFRSWRGYWWKLHDSQNSALLLQQIIICIPIFPLLPGEAPDSFWRPPMGPILLSCIQQSAPLKGTVSHLEIRLNGAVQQRDDEHFPECLRMREISIMREMLDASL
jgi:hypothetical protein